MTKERLRRYFELAFEAEERGRLDPSDSLETPRLDELDALAAEFEAWDPEAPPPPESEELKAVYDQLDADGRHYRESLKEDTKLWNDLCCYWHDRALLIEGRVKQALEIPETEEVPPSLVNEAE